MMLGGCSHANRNSFVINGEIEGIPDSTMVFIAPMSHISVDTLASAQVIGGKFSLMGATDEPLLINLLIDGSYGSKALMVANGDNVSVKGNVESSEAWDGKTSYSFSNVNVAGSAYTDTLNMRLAGRHRLDSIYNDMHVRYKGLMDAMGNARKEGNKTLLDSLQNSPEAIELASTEKYIFTALDSMLKAEIELNKDNLWGPVVIMSNLTYLTPDYREVYDNLGQPAKDSRLGREMYAMLYPVGRPGDKVKEFEGVDVNGNEVTLAKVCADNKYVLLDFWASWCRPCRAEIPNLKKIYTDAAEKGLQIVSISIDKDRQAWLDALEKEQLPWINVLDEGGKIADLYHVSAVPTMYILDSEGKLVGENLRGEELAAKISELLN